MRSASLAQISVFLAAVALLATSCSMYSFTAKATENITVAHVPATPIRVTTRNGSVQIIGGSQDQEIHVQATITACGKTQMDADERLEGIAIHCERDDEDRLVIHAVYRDQPRGREGVSFVIRVPDADGAWVRSSNGSITVSAITGHLDIETSNGRIKVKDHGGRLSIRTSNGSVTLHDVVGPVVAKTSNGTVDVALRDESTGPVNLRTSNGTVKLAVGAAFRGEMGIRTSNGRVRFQNLADADVTGKLKKRRGTLQFGRDGAVSKVRSSNGSITVTAR